MRLTVLRFAGYLLGVVLLHILAMMMLEGMSAADAAWLTLTTVTTVGYGDLSAETPLGRIATAVLLYIGGIFVLFQGATVYFDYRADRTSRMLRGRWKWRMKDHILILNAPGANPEQYMSRLVKEFRASKRFREKPILIVTERFPDGLPDDLRDMNVTHYHGDAQNPEALKCADAAEAAVILVLVRQFDDDNLSDGRSFDVLHRLQELGAHGRILAESLLDENRPRLKRAGAEIVVRPLRGYPEMIVRALVAPGAEAVLEDLFTSKKDECWRYDLRLSGRRWKDIVSCLVERDIGIAIAYRNPEDHSVVCNPRPEAIIEADKLYVIVREGNERPDSTIAELLSAISPAEPPQEAPPRQSARQRSAG